MTEEELNFAYQNRMSLPPAERAAIEKAHAEMVRRKDRERGTPNPPDNVDANLDAAATPITPDPAMKPKAAATAPVAAADPRADYEARMVAAGFTPREAAVGAEYESRQPGGFNPAFSSDEALRAGAAYMRGQDVVEARFENSAYGPRPSRAARRAVPSNVDRTYYDQVDGGMGTTPYEIIDGVMVPASVNSIDQTQWTLGDEQRAIEAREGAFRDAGGEYAFPGPRNDDGTRPERRRFSSPREAREYYTRPTNPETGQIMPSQYDSDRLNSAGEAAVYDAEGNIVYLPASPNNSQIYGPMSPSARRRQGARMGIDPSVPFDEGGDGMYEEAVRQGPLGPVTVLVPTQATREKWDTNKAARLRARLVENAGISTADADGLSDDQLRAMARDRRASDMRERRASVVRRGVARGNPLEYLGRDDVNDWQRMVVAEQFLRAPQEMTPLGVDAVGAANAMRNFNFETMAGGLPGMMRERELARDAEMRQRAYDFAVAERDRVQWDNNAPMDPALANKIRRRVAARFGAQYADVVDALPIEDSVLPEGG